MFKPLFVCLHKIVAIPSQVADLCQNLRLPRHAGQTQNLANHSQNPKPTKLLHLASDSYRGGAESVFRNTIEQTLTLQNYEVFVASCDTPKSLPKGIDSKHFLALDDWASYPKPIGALKYVFNLKNYRILKTFLFTIRPDIIHTQNYLSRLSPSVLFALRSYKRKFPHTKLIFTQHNMDSCANGSHCNYAKLAYCTQCVGHSKLRIAFKNCDRRGRVYSVLKAVRSLFFRGFLLDEKDLFDEIVCVGEFQYQRHKEDGWDIRKMRIVQNPIEMQFYNPAVSLAQKQDIIVIWGRVATEKNHAMLINAFAKLREQAEFSHYTLCIIGDGDERRALQSLAQNLFGVDQKCCQFLGRLEFGALREVLLRAKLAVFPSLWTECFGLVLVEAIIGGVIRLASGMGAYKDTIEQFCGYTFEFVYNEDKEGVAWHGDPFAQNVENLCAKMSEILRSYPVVWQEFESKRAGIVRDLLAQQYLTKLVEIYRLGGGAFISIKILLFRESHAIFASQKSLHKFHTIQNLAHLPQGKSLAGACVDSKRWQYVA